MPLFSMFSDILWHARAYCEALEYTAQKVSVFEVILVRISECRKMRTRMTPYTDTFYALTDASIENK